jgi:hypothetical protein
MADTKEQRFKIAAEVYRATDGSRAAVAKALKLSNPSATRIIREARAAGYLHEWEKREPGNARGPSGMRPPGAKPRVSVVAGMVREETDPVDRARDNDRKARIEREHRDMARQLAAESDIRDAVFKLGAAQIAVPSWEIRPHSTPGEIVPVLLTTDQHCGERVSLDEMEGLNAYDSEIFKARNRRMIERALAILDARKEHYPCFVYLFGGDSISGDIHEELSQTNDLTSHASVVTVAEETIRNLEILLDRFPKVVFIGVPGNHGRTTRKPTAKRYADLNYDTLVSLMVERHFRSVNETRIEFRYPKSGDAVFSVYGRKMLLTHGDRIGSRGGTGFIGPAATILRGAQKVFQQYAGVGVQIDTIFHGHFHYRMWLDGIVSNSAMIGFNEFARAILRARFQLPSQTLALVHPKWGVIDAPPIFLEDPPPHGYRLAVEAAA